MHKDNKTKTMTIAILIALVISAGNMFPKDKPIEGRAAIISEEEYFNGVRNVKEKYLSSVQGKNIISYKRFDVTISGKTVSVKGFTMNNVHYIPFRASASALGLSYTYDSKNIPEFFRKKEKSSMKSETCISGKIFKHPCRRRTE